MTSTPPGSPPKGVRMEVLTLETDPPGLQRLAPGGGRVLTLAVLFEPAIGENTHTPAIVLLDEGPGSHPAHWGSPSRWAAERLAQAGHTTVSLYSHMERGHPLFPVDETVHEIHAALSMLEARGYEEFILIGHSYGAIAAAYYVANHPDPVLDWEGSQRVKAVVMVNPLTELREFPNADLKRDYDARMARAQASFDSGRGSIPAGNTIAVAGGPGVASDHWIANGPFVQPAELVLDYWGPAAERRNAELIANPRKPTLMLAGGADPTVSLDKLRAVEAAHPTAKVIAYPDGDRFFKGLHDQAAQDIGLWLAEQGLAPRPRVQIRIVDAQTADGQILPGAIYRPEGKVDPSKPAFVMLHGRSGDILYSSTHWMAWRLAQAGYVVLTPSLRVSGATGIQGSNTPECAEDMAAWMDVFEGLGHKKVVLTGHSNGGVWISNYVAQSQDKRVVGMIYIAPTAVWIDPKDKMSDPAHAALYQKIAAEMADGTHRDTVMGVMSANLWWDYNRHDTSNLHTERVTKFDLPALSIVGGQDALFTDGRFMAAFRAAYKGPLEEVVYENGSHGFRENKERISADLVRWTRKTFG